MPTYRTQATIETTDNIAANFATNTWYCTADDLAALDDFVNELKLFYTTIDSLMGNLTKGTDGLKLKSYDMADPEPRAPVNTTQQTLTPDGGGCLPTECALVCSFQAARESGVSQARRRGRVYIPFPRVSLNDATGRPASSGITVLQGGAKDLLDASQAATTWKWVVYSTVSASTSEVDNGWVDNEWDTQRRRGRIATTRTTFT